MKALGHQGRSLSKRSELAIAYSLHRMEYEVEYPSTSFHLMTFFCTCQNPYFGDIGRQTYVKVSSLPSQTSNYAANQTLFLSY